MLDDSGPCPEPLCVFCFLVLIYFMNIFYMTWRSLIGLWFLILSLLSLSWISKNSVIGLVYISALESMCECLLRYYKLSLHISTVPFSLCPFQLLFHFSYPWVLTLIFLWELLWCFGCCDEFLFQVLLELNKVRYGIGYTLYNFIFISNPNVSITKQITQWQKVTK